MGSRLWWPAVDRAARRHILGFVVVLAVALFLHYGVLPFFVRRVGIRETPAYFLAIALVPIALWLVPAFSRALARGASKPIENCSARRASTCGCRPRSRSVCGTPS